MRVKICGLTLAEDAAYAERLGAWALGFIFYEKSPRYIPPERAGVIISALKTQAWGVFVNQPDLAIDIAPKIGLKGIQLHGNETPEEVKRVRDNFKGVVVKAYRPEKIADHMRMVEYTDDVDYLLVDAAKPGQYGGSGQTVDWDLARAATNIRKPIILAGGLNPDNIVAAMSAVTPYAADLSSGVEARPGVKDRAKLDALFDKIKGLKDESERKQDLA